MTSSIPSAVAAQAESVPTTVLLTLIERDLQHATELAQLLRDEQQAMAERQRQAMPVLIEKKITLLDKLDHNASERYQLLTSLGLEADENHWLQLIEANADKTLREKWQTLLATLGECKRRNLVNGKVVARSRQSLDKLIHILRGQFQTPQLYNQKGSTEDRYQSTTVVKA